MCHLTLNFVFVFATVAVAEESAFLAPDYVARGMDRFRKNEIDASVKAFERAVAVSPEIKPHLWQLGISYYYAGKFEAGQKLFESHQAVNRNDVENAAWHFICVARLKGIEAARKQLLKIDASRDARIPMSEVYQLYAGQGSAKAVLAAASNADTELARMYAHLYLGLYYEVAKKPEQAREQMRKSATAKLSKNYMHEVAKVHLLQRKWNRESPAK